MTGSIDPTGTTALRRQFLRAAVTRSCQYVAALHRAVVNDDVLGGGGTAMRLHPPAARLAAFQYAVERAAQPLMAPWFAAFLANAAAQGTAAAAGETRHQSGLPFPLDHATAAAASELTGIVAATAQRMTRGADLAIRSGARPTKAWRMLNAELTAVLRPRLKVWINTTVVQIYNGAKLAVYESAGLTHVGVSIECLHGGAEPRDPHGEWAAGGGPGERGGLGPRVERRGGGAAGGFNALRVRLLRHRKPNNSSHDLFDKDDPPKLKPKAKSWETSFETWKEAHEAAQARANEIGHDVGLWRVNEFGKERFNIRSLPKPENRYGHELQAEVVSPDRPTHDPFGTPINWAGKTPKSFWSFKAPDPPPDPPPGSSMTQAEWESFSPGMRREIMKEFERTPPKGSHYTQAEWQAMSPAMRKEIAEPSSWVIVHKETGAPVMETFSEEVKSKINTERYEAKPAMEYLIGYNERVKQAGGVEPPFKPPEPSAGLIDPNQRLVRWRAGPDEPYQLVPLMKYMQNLQRPPEVGISPEAWDELLPQTKMEVWLGKGLEKAIGALTKERKSLATPPEVAPIPPEAPDLEELPEDLEEVPLIGKRRRKVNLELVNILNSGDDRVCNICLELSEDGPYTLAEAKTLIPAHVNCRCAVTPAFDKRFKGNDAYLFPGIKTKFTLEILS